MKEVLDEILQGIDWRICVITLLSILIFFLLGTVLSLHMRMEDFKNSQKNEGIALPYVKPIQTNFTL